MEQNKIQVLDHGFVELVYSMGGDELIVTAARVSTGTGSKGVAQDSKLIRYLMERGHTSPFEMVRFIFHVRAPLFVVGQWQRHRTFTYMNWNQLSARYTEMKDEFYLPDQWRAQGNKNKQGSVPAEEAYDQSVIQEEVKDFCTSALHLYKGMLERGVAREMARMVLPQNIYTEFYCSVDLHNLFHFLELRLAPEAQWEIRQYALALESLVAKQVPLAYEAWKSRQTPS